MYRFKIDIKELAMVRNRFDKALSNLYNIKALFWRKVSPILKKKLYLNVGLKLDSWSSWKMANHLNKQIKR